MHLFLQSYLHIAMQGTMHCTSLLFSWLKIFSKAYNLSVAMIFTFKILFYIEFNTHTCVQVHACRLYRPDRSVRVEALVRRYGRLRDGAGSVRHTPVALRTPRGEHAPLCLHLSVNILWKWSDFLQGMLSTLKTNIFNPTCLFIEGYFLWPSFLYNWISKNCDRGWHKISFETAAENVIIGKVLPQ